MATSVLPGSIIRDIRIQYGKIASRLDTGTRAHLPIIVESGANPQNPLQWLILGVIMAVLELLLPSLFFIGFALGAAWAALLLFVAPAAVTNIAALLLIWVLASGLSWIVLRILFRNRFAKDKPAKGDINEY